jgi:hypothetical protein
MEKELSQLLGRHRADIISEMHVNRLRVDCDLAWDVVTVDLPPLVDALRRFVPSVPIVVRIGAQSRC